MKKELGTSHVGREDLWKRARRHKDGHFSPSVQVVIDKMDHVSQQVKAGGIEYSGRDDVLALALGKPEHPGRVRGMGMDVTITDYFKPSTSCVDSGVGEDAIVRSINEANEKLEAKILEMKEIHTKSQAKSQEEITELKDYIVELLGILKKINPDLPDPKFGLHPKPGSHPNKEATPYNSPSIGLSADVQHIPSKPVI